MKNPIKSINEALKGLIKLVNKNITMFKTDSKITVTVTITTEDGNRVSLTSKIKPNGDVDNKYDDPFPEA